MSTDDDGLHVVTGFSAAGMYIVAESWINDQALRETARVRIGAAMKGEPKAEVVELPKRAD